VRQVLALMFVAACGRLGFDDRSSDASATKSSDATPPPIDGDTSASACLTTYAICDGFEGSNFEPVWTVSSGATLDNTVAHRGTQSLHVHTDAIAVNDGDNEGVAETTTFGSATAQLYIRAFVRFAAVPVNHMGVIEAAQATGTDPMTDGVFETNDGLVVYSQFTDTSDETMLQPTLDAWTCLVFEIVRASDSTGELALTGDFSGELDHVQTDGNPPLAALGLGIAFANSTDQTAEPAYDLWIDDVIVAYTPLTCAD
jgi:hypothetical protein